MSYLKNDGVAKCFTKTWQVEDSKLFVNNDNNIATIASEQLNIVACWI